jgi:4-hydroxy-3-polyprenylbenzoate decarboxylase
MKGPRDLRDWIDLLRREGELVEIDRPVDPHLEITEIADRVIKGGGPALLFTNVTGSEIPVLINQFGTERRMLLALGVDRLDAIAEEIGELLELKPPDGLTDKVRALGRLKSIADSRPKVVGSGPCQEVVITDPDLDRLPIMTCWPDDGGPYVTLPNVITVDPRTGGRNVGMYRLQKHGPRELGLHWQIHKDAAADWRLGAGRMEVAVALGTDPITTYAGSMPLPKHIDEYMVAGYLRGEPIELVQCKTVDLQVPANAEIVIEGYCERGELRPEGPFGDHTGYYTPVEDFPVMQVTAITHRRDPVYPSIVVGVPPSEDVWLGKATERIFLPAVKMTNPEIVDYDLPFAGAFHNCAIVSIKKAFPGHARKVMHAVWGTGLLSLTKAVIVVDHWVDVHDYTEVVWQMGANIDPAHDVLLSSGPLDQLDHAARIQSLGGKIGFDATAKWPSEGYTRDWPEVARMDGDVVERVDAMWDALGIDLPGFGAADRPVPPAAPGRGGILGRVWGGR